MEGETASTMTAFLAMLTEVCTSLMTQVTNVCSFIIQTPLLVFTVGIMFLGAAVGIISRLIRR